MSFIYTITSLTGLTNLIWLFAICSVQKDFRLRQEFSIFVVCVHSFTVEETEATLLFLLLLLLMLLLVQLWF